MVAVETSMDIAKYAKNTPFPQFAGRITDSFFSLHIYVQQQKLSLNISRHKKIIHDFVGVIEPNKQTIAIFIGNHGNEPHYISCNTAILKKFLGYKSRSKE